MSSSILIEFAAIAALEFDAEERRNDLADVRICRYFGREIRRDRAFAARHENARRNAQIALTEARALARGPFIGSLSSPEKLWQRDHVRIRFGK